MGGHMDSLFGSKWQVVLAGIFSFITTIYSMAIQEGSYVVHLVLIAVVSLMIADTILGILISRRRETFSSKGFSRILEKIIVYTLAVIGLTSFGVLVAAVPSASGVAIPTLIVVSSAKAFFMFGMILVGLTEFISVKENLSKLGFRLPKKIDDAIDVVSEKLSPPEDNDDE